MTLRPLLIAIALLSAAAGAHAANWYVATTGSDANAGTAAAPFLTIQKGLNAAATGDIVLVVAGTYSGPGNNLLDFHGKNLTLMSLGGYANCTLDLRDGQKAFWFAGGDYKQTVVNGFTLKNGLSDSRGAAAYIEGSPSFVNCVFTGCQLVKYGSYANGGGAVWVNAGSPTFTGCVFSNNTVSGNTAVVGGAGFVGPDATATFTRCSFTGNAVSATDAAGVVYGGALAAMGSVTLTDCSFSGNTATAPAQAFGGAVYLQGGGAHALSGCTFDSNSASGSTRADGGAIGIFSADVTGGSVSCTNCTVTNNTAQGAAADGGGVSSSGVPVTWNGGAVNGNTAMADSAASGGGFMLMNGAGAAITGAQVRGNASKSPTAARGGGLYIQDAGTLTLSRCDASGNTLDRLDSDGASPTARGGGIYALNGATVSVLNCLAFSNAGLNISQGEGAFLYASGSRTNVLVGNATVVGNAYYVQSSRGGGIAVTSGAAATLVNSIVWHNYVGTNGSTEDDVNAYGGGTVQASYNDIGTNPAAPDANHNFGADPMFVQVDIGGLNFHLKPGSPAINAGTTNTPYPLTTDLDGSPRVMDGAPDLGAYEYLPANALFVNGATGSDANS